MLFLDNAAPDSCCAVAHTHISTFGIYSSHNSRDNVGTETQTDRPTDRPTEKPIDYNNPLLRMRARGLMKGTKVLTLGAGR